MELVCAAFREVIPDKLSGCHRLADAVELLNIARVAVGFVGRIFSGGRTQRFPVTGRFRGDRPSRAVEAGCGQNIVAVSVYAVLAGGTHNSGTVLRIVEGNGLPGGARRLFHDFGNALAVSKRCITELEFIAIRSFDGGNCAVAIIGKLGLFSVRINDIAQPSRAPVEIGGAPGSVRDGLYRQIIPCGRDGQGVTRPIGHFIDFRHFRRRIIVGGLISVAVHRFC